MVSKTDLNKQFRVLVQAIEAHSSCDVCKSALYDFLLQLEGDINNANEVTYVVRNKKDGLNNWQKHFEFQKLTI